MLKCAQIAVGTLAAATLAAATVGSWESFKSPEGKFSIEFPGRAQYFTQAAESAGGETIKVHLFGVESSGLAYLVSYNDYAFAADGPAHADQILNGVINGVAGSMKATVEKSEKMNLGKTPGRAAILKSDNGSAQLRAYFSGARLYQVLVMGPSVNEGSPESKRFFASFKIIR